MKKLFLLLLLLVLGSHPAYGYTNEKWKIEYEISMEWFDLDSTVFYPKGFLDGSIIKDYNQQPMWAGRTYWTKGIDDANIDCAVPKHKSYSAPWYFHRKCFIRHAGMFTKIDISGNWSMFPMTNNVFTVEVPSNLQGDFEFWLAWFWASSSYWLGSSGGMEVWTNGKNHLTQWAAVQIFPLDKDGNELKDAWNYSKWFPVYSVDEDGNEFIASEWIWKGKRNVVTSMNPKLFRGKYLTSGARETRTNAYNNTSAGCVPQNIIFGLTPKLFVKKEHLKSNATCTTKINGVEVPTIKIWVRLMPIVKGNNWKSYEPSYLADDEMGKVALKWEMWPANYTVHNEAWNSVGRAWAMSNYLAFATNSSIKTDGIYNNKIAYNQILSAFTVNGDINSSSTLMSRPSSEYLSYNGNFVTHQMRRLSDKYYAPLQEYNWDNSYVMPSSLGNNIGAGSQNGVVTREFQSDNFIHRWLAKKWESEILLFTLDMDNKYSSTQAGPPTDTSFGFATVDPKVMREIIKIKSMAREEMDEALRFELLNEQFEKLKSSGITSAYLKSTKWVWSLVYNGKFMKFLANSSQIESHNENHRGNPVVKPSSLIDIKNSNVFKIPFKNKNYVNGGSLSKMTADLEWSVEDNLQKDSEFTTQGYAHWNGMNIHNGAWWNFHHMLKKWFGVVKIKIWDIIVNKNEREKYLKCEWEWPDEKCTLKEDYTFYYFISFSKWSNAIGYSFGNEYFKWPWNCLTEDGWECNSDELVPIDLGVKLNQLCTFRKAVDAVYPSQAYYKLLNADKSCKDIVVKHLFSATQDQWTDAFNQAWTIKEEPIENPTEPLQPWQRATMEVNHTNVCDLAFVGKVIASNTDILQRDIKDLKLRISSIPKNVEMLDAADINVWDKSVKFKSKPKGSDMNVENPILNTLWLLPWEDTKKVQWDFIIQACNGDIYRTPLNGDSDEQELYLKLEADSNAWAKSKGSKVCQYAFEYAFRPLAPQCSAIDTNTYGTDDSGEITVGKVKNGEPTTFKYPEDGSNRVVKDYEGFTSKSGEMAKYLTFTDMRIGNFGFCFELIKKYLK